MGMVLAVLAGGPAQKGWQLIGSMGSTGVCRPHWGVGFAHSAINVSHQILNTPLKVRVTVTQCPS